MYAAVHHHPVYSTHSLTQSPQTAQRFSSSPSLSIRVRASAFSPHPLPHPPSPLYSAPLRLPLSLARLLARRPRLSPSVWLMSDGNPLIFFSEWPLAIRRRRRHFQSGQSVSCLGVRSGWKRITGSREGERERERVHPQRFSLSLGYKSDVMHAPSSSEAGPAGAI